MADSDQEAEALDLEPDEDDFMDLEDDDLDDTPPPLQAPPPKNKSDIAGCSAPRKTKGRGFNDDAVGYSQLSGGNFDSINSDEGRGPGPGRSIEGWTILVTGVHEEAQEEDLRNEFGEFGVIKDLRLNLDRRTGFVKGYALIVYEYFEEARAAIEQMNGRLFLIITINVDWAFRNGPIDEWRNYTAIRERRYRSRSPSRRY